jgi:hypothetical protein
MRPYATSACGLMLLVYEALSHLAAELKPMLAPSKALSFSSAEALVQLLGSVSTKACASSKLSSKL